MSNMAHCFLLGLFSCFDKQTNIRHYLAFSRDRNKLILVGDWPVTPFLNFFSIFFLRRGGSGAVVFPGREGVERWL